MRERHMDFVKRWANFIKENPDQWKPMHREFINAQYDLHKKFIKNIKKTSNWKEKLIKLYKIKNLNAFKEILELD